MALDGGPLCILRLVTEIHVFKLRRDLLDHATYPRVGRLDLAPISHLAVPTRFGHGNCVLQLRNIDSNKSFFVVYNQPRLVLLL